MKTNKTSIFFEWSIYALAVVSLILLTYLFSTRNKTSIILEETKQIVSPVINIEHDLPTPISEKSTHTNVIDTQNLVKDINIAEEPEDIPSPPIAKKNDVDNIKEISYKKKEHHSTSKYNHNKISQKKKKKEKSYKKKHNPSQQHKKVLDTKQRYASIKYFHKPKLMKKSSYNWVVLNRYMEKPDQKLYKIGTYTVQKKDTIYSIGKKFQVKPINIIAVNKKLSNPDVLLPNKVIYISNK